MPRQKSKPVEVVVVKKSPGPVAGCLSALIVSAFLIVAFVLGIGWLASQDGMTRGDPSAPKPAEPAYKGPEAREIPTTEYDRAADETTVFVDLFMMEDPWWYRIEATFQGERWSTGRQPAIRIFRVADEAPIEAVRIHDPSDREDGMREIRTPNGRLGYRELIEVLDSPYGDFLIDGGWVPESPQSISAFERFCDTLKLLDRGFRMN
jgi:hypothetical protein